MAIPLCRKAVQELEQRTGRNNPDLATLLNILAVIYREQGRFKEAIRVLQETLEIRENVFGPAHAAVASTLNNLSVLHGKCGDFKTAEPFCQRALEIRQEVSCLTDNVIQNTAILGTRQNGCPRGELYIVGRILYPAPFTQALLRLLNRTWFEESRFN